MLSGGYNLPSIRWRDGFSFYLLGDAGWSSPVARQAHNLKVVGSNPTPATNKNNHLAAFKRLFFCPHFYHVSTAKVFLPCESILFEIIVNNITIIGSSLCIRLN